MWICANCNKENLVSQSKCPKCGFSAEDNKLVICPYCNQPSKLEDSKIIYKKSYGFIWICISCNAYVGCHNGTNKPKGSLANAELRVARIRAHAAFDSYWKINKINRNIAYRQLARKLAINPTQCHIGMFDIETCNRVIELYET